ncbi:MAG: ribonuclease P protein component [Eubacterium sp.]
MKGQTLKENKDFRRLYYRGKSVASPVLVTYAMKNRRGSCFYGITTSKKIGKAVDRNRAKRVIRASFEELKGDINGNWDFVFVARTKTTKVKMQEVRQAMYEQFCRLGVISDEKD